MIPATLCTFCDSPATHVNTHTDGTDPVPACVECSIPEDWPVHPAWDDDDPSRLATCGTCGLSWDDVTPTSMTPTPSGRCPFEAFHGAAD